MSAQDDTDAGLLFDFAVVHPDGFTNQEAMDEFGWTRSRFTRIARQVRLILADDTITLTCDPEGQRERWRYRLVGTYHDSRGWSSNRLRDLEARLETIQAFAASIVNATDGRRVDGRKAKLILAVVGALREQLVVMSDQGHLWDD